MFALVPGAEQRICDRFAVDALTDSPTVGLRPTATICDAFGIIPCGDRGAVTDGSRCVSAAPPPDSNAPAHADPGGVKEPRGGVRAGLDPIRLLCPGFRHLS